MKIKSFGISLAVTTALSFSLIACGGGEKEKNTPNLGSGIVTESNVPNDIYTSAQELSFSEDGTLTINGVANSANDPIDWYKVVNINANGRYICAVEAPYHTTFSSSDVFWNTSTEVGGTEISGYGYGAYKHYSDGNNIIEQDSRDKYTSSINTLFIEVHANDTQGNDTNYKYKCWTESAHQGTIQTGNIIENQVPNGIFQHAQKFNLDSNSNATITGTVNERNDKYEYFKFTPTETGTYNIITSDRNQFLINLYNNDKSVISSNNDSFKLYANSSYFLKITASNTNNSNSKYIVKIKKQ